MRIIYFTDKNENIE